MIDSILADTMRWITTSIVIVAYAFIFAMVIISLARVAAYFRAAGKEQKLIRMELAKLAEEVQLIRRELKGAEDTDSSEQPG